LCCGGGLYDDENILLPLMIDKKKVDEYYFQNLTKTLGIDDRLEHYPKQLSGGQQQRVAIARALINKPQVLLCDEPTGNLDSKSGEEVMSLLRKMQHEMGQTIIMVTHDSNIASQADAIVRIEDGRVSLDS
jgi:putative ABC transport system ATP-binding protein